MIIQCINCSKKFEVSYSLIPETGRNIQCGSCNHTWFYKHIVKTPASKNQSNDKEDKIEIFDTIKNKKVDFDQKDDEVEDEKVDKYDISEKFKDEYLPKSNKSTGFRLSNLLSYIIVAIISFIALVIILDTFKSPLSNFFPGLELLLYNLFETIKDITLFFNNLLV